jgi:hypothetical protein
MFVSSSTAKRTVLGASGAITTSVSYGVNTSDLLQPIKVAAAIRTRNIFFNTTYPTSISILNAIAIPYAG